MRKRAGGIVPLCDLAAREKTSVSGVVEELLQGWLEGTHKLEDSLSIKFNRITQRKTPPSPVGFFVSYESSRHQRFVLEVSSGGSRPTRKILKKTMLSPVKALPGRRENEPVHRAEWQLAVC